MATPEDEHLLSTDAVIRSATSRPDEAGVLSMLKASANGDVDAFARLYDATGALVYRLSLLVLRDEQAAMSSTRRTYATVWDQASRYDGGRQGSALSWLVTIAYAEARARIA